MARDLDPEGIEARHLAKVVDLRGARVLEVGSGDGRLTSFYAQDAELVLGIDVKVDVMIRSIRPHPLAHVSYAVANASTLPFAASAFDVVLFARSF
jgi:ubiquinone/menaquinone biosynthesis C-methylase UbiE